jgi:hypothetical protein
MASSIILNDDNGVYVDITDKKLNALRKNLYRIQNETRLSSLTLHCSFCKDTFHHIDRKPYFFEECLHPFCEQCLEMMKEE